MLLDSFGPCATCDQRLGRFSVPEKAGKLTSCTRDPKNPPESTFDTYHCDFSRCLVCVGEPAPAICTDSRSLRAISTDSDNEKGLLALQYKPNYLPPKGIESSKVDGSACVLSKVVSERLVSAPELTLSPGKSDSGSLFLAEDIVVSGLYEPTWSVGRTHGSGRAETV